MDQQKKICCFGEILLRFSPELNGKFINDAKMSMYVGGAELNVATALAAWEQPVKYVSAMPNNYLSKEILTSIEDKNINASSFILIGDRIGSYYLPQGADLKNSGVIYDRAHSSFANLKPGEIDWEPILKDANWFHFSAISPALNEDAAKICLEAVKAAKERNIPISLDLNYRAKLWQYGKKPIEVMPELAQYCSVIMGNIWAAKNLLGVLPEVEFEKIATTREEFLAQSALSASALQEAFPSCHTVANTFRFDKDEGIEYYASLHTKDAASASSTYATDYIVDKVGSGDCFMAGLLYGLINNHAPKDIIEFAAAAAFAKLQQLGDATTSKVMDVQKTINNHG